MQNYSPQRKIKRNMALRNLFLLSLFPQILLFWPENLALAQTPSKPIKASIGGSISNEALPKPESTEPEKIEYPSPGTIAITTTQYCGDGDVVNFSQTYPTFDFASSGNLNFVLGVWFAPSGTSKPVPNGTNWLPLAKTSGPVDLANITNMSVINKASESRSTMSIVTDALNAFHKKSGFRMPAQASGAKYEMRMAVHMCKTIDAATSRTSDLPAPWEMIAAVQDLPSQIEAAVDDKKKNDNGQAEDSWDFHTKSYDLKLAGNGISVTPGKNKDHDVSNDPLFDLGTKILALNDPDPAPATVDEYKTYIQDKAPADVFKVYNEFNTAGACLKGQVTGVTKEGTYWWEQFSMNITCLALDHFQDASFKDLMTALFSPDVIPDQTAFKEAKARLAALFFKAGMTQDVLARLQNDYASARATDRCFDLNSSGNPERPYIYNIMGSLPISLKASNPTNVSTSRHPEGLFALMDYSTYFSDNSHTIYQMPGEGYEGFGASEIQMGANNPVPPVLSKSFQLNFHTRGTGCTKNWYCQNDRKTDFYQETRGAWWP